MPESSERGPRYVFVTDLEVVGDGEGDRPSRCAWRLLAANNRPLGRSVGTFTSMAECRRDAALLRASAGTLIATSSFDVGTGRWTWLVGDGEQRQAMSVRAYLRRFECRRAAQQYLDAVAVADPAGGVVRVVGARGMQQLEMVPDVDPGRVTT